MPAAKLGSGMRGQHRMQRGGAARVDSCHRNVASFRLLQGTGHHFMRNRIGKKNDKVRTSQLLFKRSILFGINFRFIAVFFTNTFILPFHSLISAHNYNAHIHSFLSAPAAVPEQRRHTVIYISFETPFKLVYTNFLSNHTITEGFCQYIIQFFEILSTSPSYRAAIDLWERRTSASYLSFVVSPCGFERNLPVCRQPRNFCK